MKNATLAVQVINHILDNPDLWDRYHCHHKNRHSFDGFVQIMGGYPERNHSWLDVMELLQCSVEDAMWLSCCYRTLSELHAYVKSYVEGVPYFDAEGFNTIGFGRDGFNRFNRNRDGRWRLGYDRNGYDRNGYDRNGYDRRRNRLPRLGTTATTAASPHD